MSIYKWSLGFCDKKSQSRKKSGSLKGQDYREKYFAKVIYDNLHHLKGGAQLTEHMKGNILFKHNNRATDSCTEP